MPTEVARRISLFLESHSRTLLLSAAVQNTLGFFGCVAHVYTSHA